MPPTNGYGYGSGYGDGYGSGYGYGSGSGYGYGYGDGHGDGDGSGYGDGYGYGDGHGDGDGYGYGSPLPEQHGHIGGFDVQSSAVYGALRVGCEVRTLADWIANAEAIDKAHGSPGLHEQTRALAVRLQSSITKPKRPARAKGKKR